VSSHRTDVKCVTIQRSSSSSSSSSSKGSKGTRSGDIMFMYLFAKRGEGSTTLLVLSSCDTQQPNSNYCLLHCSTAAVVNALFVVTATAADVNATATAICCHCYYCNMFSCSMIPVCWILQPRSGYKWQSRFPGLLT
jgi:hypothetical protein